MAERTPPPGQDDWLAGRQPGGDHRAPSGGSGLTQEDIKRITAPDAGDVPQPPRPSDAIQPPPPRPTDAMSTRTGLGAKKVGEHMARGAVRRVAGRYTGPTGDVDPSKVHKGFRKPGKAFKRAAIDAARGAGEGALAARREGKRNRWQAPGPPASSSLSREQTPGDIYAEAARRALASDRYERETGEEDTFYDG